jgi:hypothetical protein
MLIIGAVVIVWGILAAAVIVVTSRPAREVAYKLGYAAGYEDALEARQADATLDDGKIRSIH